MFIAAAGAADIIWAIFIGILVVVSAIIKKKKERAEMDEGMAEREQEKKAGRYVANEGAIKSFLKQIGAEPPPPPRPQRKPAVYTAEAVSGPQPPKPVSRRAAPEPVPQLSAYAVKPEHLPQRSISREAEKTTLVRAARKGARHAEPPRRPVAPPSPRAGEDVFDVVEEFREPVTLPARLTMMQRAVIWREILDSPPGLRSGMIFPREI